MRTEVENGQIARYLLMQTYNLDNDEVTETVVRNYNDPKKKSSIPEPNQMQRDTGTDPEG
jgi:hypothetical protein